MNYSCYQEQVLSEGLSDVLVDCDLNDGDGLTESKRKVAKLFEAGHEYFPVAGAKILTADGQGGAMAVQSGLILSTALLLPVEISRIRACISNGGLDINLMNYLMLVHKMTQGQFGGVHFGSKRISFEPCPPFHQPIIQFEVDNKMSTSMEAFNCIPIFLFARPHLTEEMGIISSTEMQFIGATDNDVLQFEYLDWILIPTLERFIRMRVEAQLLKRGFQLNGKGSMCMNVWSLPSGSTIEPIIVTDHRKRVQKVTVRIFRAGGGYHKGSLQPILDAVHEELDVVQQEERELFKDNLEFEIEDSTIAETGDTSYGSGMGILLVAETQDGCILGGQSMGSLWFVLAGISGDSSKQHAIIEGRAAAQRAVKDLRGQLRTGCCLDKRIHASLITYMALAKGVSQIWIPKVTPEIESAMKAVQYVTGVQIGLQFSDPNANTRFPETNAITVHGLGIAAPVPQFDN